MILYRFSTWWTGKNELFSVTQIEVEEKTKIYIGKGCRVRKEDIGILTTHGGNEMYLLDNDPAIYIDAMIKRCKSSIDIAEIRLKEAQEKLSKWSELAERKNNDKNGT